MIHGNLEGIRESVLEDLEKIYDMEFERDAFLPDRLLSLLIRYTEILNRELMIYMSRDGSVLEISIGSISSVGLPERHLRRNLERLSGIRCIHTHPGGNARLSDVDEQALRLLRFDAICAVGVAEQRATGISAAFLGEIEYGQFSVISYGPVKPGRIPQMLWMREIELADARVQKALESGGVVDQAERALLISIDSDRSMTELNSLADTAGAVVVARAIQNRQHPDPATYIGRGKAEELALNCQAAEVDLAIIDDELTGAQQRNLEDVLGVRVIDRTTLILDIFARHAVSREGKLQVELAQLKYRLPRLVGMGAQLSRLGGGIGTRGPGETRLEVDRRRIRKRLDDLAHELSSISKQRDQRRARRAKDDQTVVALVGYTNSGKSSLLNALSGSDVLVEDKLFATLDPVVRKLELPGAQSCLLVDTVGFIDKLPHSLVEAFHSTLEEALYADVLVIVSDLSSNEYAHQRAVVREVLESLGAGGKPVIEALNKADIADIQSVVEPADAIIISAKRGDGLLRLSEAIAEKVSGLYVECELTIPYAKGAVLSLIHEQGHILAEEYLENGTRLKCRLDQSALMRVRKMLETNT